MKKLLALFVAAFCLVGGLFAVTLDLDDITENHTDSAVLTANNGDTVKGKLNLPSCKLQITAGATVVLDNVNVSSNMGEFPGITCLGDATIKLMGANFINAVQSGYPGIFVPEGKTLTIQTFEEGGSGVLSVEGGSYAAGIGSGGNPNADRPDKDLYHAGNIVINGGTVIAQGGRLSSSQTEGGAGIGSGCGGSAGDITINGGTVTARADKGAAGIGTGYTQYRGPKASVGNINIFGGTVVATSSADAWDGGAGIGTGGSYSNSQSIEARIGAGGICQTITISGPDTTVAATGSVRAAGIGAGALGCLDNIVINRGSTVTAKGGDYATGIGTGELGKMLNFGFGISFITATCGNGHGEIPIGTWAFNSNSDPGEQYGAYWSTGSWLDWEYATYVSRGYDPQGYSDWRFDETVGNTRTIRWNGNLSLKTLDFPITAVDGMVLYGNTTDSGDKWKLSIADGATVTLSNAYINTYVEESGWHNENTPWAGINCKGDATIVLKGVNHVKPFNINYPGIYVPASSGEFSSLKIKGRGRLTTSSKWGAGIGGGAYDTTQGNYGIVQIYDGFINASSEMGGAGIGGGYKGAGYQVSILGGVVNAKGGHGGAGIGTGWEGTISNIGIADGTVVNAEGGAYAAGIGSGWKGRVGSNVEVDVGDITATGSDGAQPIGAGVDGSVYFKVVHGDGNRFVDTTSGNTRTIRWTGNLDGLQKNPVAHDGTIIRGRLPYDIYKVFIAPGATVTLSGADIPGASTTRYTDHYSGVYVPFAGITCMGDATFIIEDNNFVRPYGSGMPAVAYYSGHTLTVSDQSTGTIDADGSFPGAPQLLGARLLDAGNEEYGGAGFGAGCNEDCGDLVINGGEIVAQGGYGAAGLGGAHGGDSGDITINGGTVWATGGTGAAGIGGGDDSGSGDIAISGANVNATSGANGPAPISKGTSSSSSISVNGALVDTTSGNTRTIITRWDGDLSVLEDGADVTASDGIVIRNTLTAKAKVSIADGAAVVLSNANVNTSGTLSGTWAGLTCLGDATIILSSANTVKGFAENYPGIHVPEGHTLTINGLGSLDARGNFGAGIGGGYGIPCGNIVILGGTITAQGGSWAAGIGGGHNTGGTSSNKSRCGTISILGGNVTATGGSEAAGIGTGRSSCCGDIVIAPGVTVIAQRGSNSNPISTGSAIGYGTLTVPTAADGMSDTTLNGIRTIRPLEWDGDLSMLTRNAIATDGMTIYNTLVGNYKVSIAANASVTLSNATITCGQDSEDYKWAGLSCLGNATITLVDENSVKGFHKNYPGIHIPSGSLLTIEGGGTLNASSNGRGAGIGGGWELDCGHIIINGGKVNATGGTHAAGIGAGREASCGDIGIYGGTIVAKGGSEAAGIGSGYCYSSCGDIVIANTHNLVRVQARRGGDTELGDRTQVPIGNGGSSSTCHSVTIQPNGLRDDERSPIRTIEWNGDLEVLRGDDEGGVTVSVPSGMTLYGTLGGKLKLTIAHRATVMLSNATINVSGGNDPKYNWAGITCEGDAKLLLKGSNNVHGFYEEYPGIYVPVGSQLIIDGSGSLSAESNGYAAGIGGGWELDCGRISIRGGEVSAWGGRARCAAIGSGYRASCEGISITGGSVSAEGSLAAAGIGSGNEGSCGSVIIEPTITRVVSKCYQGGIPVGAGLDGTCGTVVTTGLKREGSDSDWTWTFTPFAYADWATANGVTGAWDATDSSGVANVFRYAFDVPSGAFGEDSVPPLLSITFDADGKAVVETPPLVNSAGFTFTIEASDNVDGTGNVESYPLNASGGTVIDETGNTKRFFRLKAIGANE